MNFERVINTVGDFLDRERRRHAVAGAIALHAYGISRARRSRTTQGAMRDLADVQSLLRLPRIDQHEVRSYFEHAGLLERYHQLSRHA